MTTSRATLRRPTLFLTMVMISVISHGCAFDPTLADEETVGEGELALKNATPVAAGDLTGMVSVTTWRGFCSGMMISETAALTAAHCVCTEDYVGGNVCSTDATVHFRPSPTGVPGGSVAGSAVWHPDYNPSWIDGHIKHDLAVITIPLGSMPSHVIPFAVASAYTPIGAQATLAGFGHTGSDCNGPSGTLNWDSGVVDSYEDSGGIVDFVHNEWCPGDSGGAAILADGTPSPKVADISGDGISDFVWFRASDRRVEGWLLDTSGGFAVSTLLGYADPGWSLRATGTFN